MNTIVTIIIQQHRGYLGHVHLQEALLEVAQLSPDVLVHLASRRHMLSGHNDAVPLSQFAPALITGL